MKRALIGITLTGLSACAGEDRRPPEPQVQVVSPGKPQLPIQIEVDRQGELPVDEEIALVVTLTPGRDCQGLRSAVRTLEGVHLFLAAAPQDPRQPAGDHYQKGAAYFRNGQLNEAIAQFEEATRIAPADVRAWRSLGVTYAAQGNYRLAEGPLRKACEMDRRDQDACYYLGLASYNLGRYENAIEAYKTCPQSRRRRRACA